MGLETSKESCRDRRGLPLIETTRRDFAYALRQVRRSPGFAAVAVITLALGLTVNAAIFRDVMLVVGVVDELRVWAIANTNSPLIFYPLAQHFQQSVTIVARTGMDPIEITASVKQAVAQLDSDIPI